MRAKIIIIKIGTCLGKEKKWLTLGAVFWLAGSAGQIWECPWGHFPLHNHPHTKIGHNRPYFYLLQSEWWLYISARRPEKLLLLLLSILQRKEQVWSCKTTIPGLQPSFLLLARASKRETPHTKNAGYNVTDQKGRPMHWCEGEEGWSKLLGSLYAPPVLDSLHAQLVGGIVVAHYRGVRVHLYCRSRPHVADSSFCNLLESNGLIHSSDDDDDFLGILGGGQRENFREK